MDQFDQANLKFLLSCNPQQLRAWYNTVSDEDLLYANNLMERYAEFLESEIRVEQIETKLRSMPVMVEAQAVIASLRG